MDVTLRPAGPGDAEFLRLLYASTRDAELALVDWDDAGRAAFLRMQFEAQDRHYRAQFPEARFDVIEREGRPIGRLYVDRSPDEIRVIDIALLPEHRRRGIGTALLRAILEESVRGGRPVRLHVERTSPAARFYERLGFVSLDEGPIYRGLEFRASDQPKTAS